MSGTVIGSKEFINGLIRQEDEVSPNGHKAPPVKFGVGDATLCCLRDLMSVRKAKKLISGKGSLPMKNDEK